MINSEDKKERCKIIYLNTIYSRVSTNDVEEYEWSKEEQSRLFIEYAEKNNMDILGVY